MKKALINKASEMEVDLYDRLRELRKMSSSELRKLWLEAFGQKAPNAFSVSMLATQLATHMRKTASSMLEEQREEELLGQFLLESKKQKRPAYVPHPGVVRKRHYKGKDYFVRETKAGLEFENEIYKSYTAIAFQITGQKRNGCEFFKIKEAV